MKTFSLILLVTASLPAICQMTDHRLLAPWDGKDYIVGKLHDTLQVQVILPSNEMMPLGDSVWLQDQLVILQGNQRVELYPEHLEGFCHKGIYRESLWWLEDATTSPPTIHRKFCQRLVSGAISVFTCNQVITDNEGYKKVKAVLYYKRDSQYQQVDLSDFNPGISKLISKGTEQSGKKRNEELKIDDFLTMVQQYNKHLQAKTSY